MELLDLLQNCSSNKLIIIRDIITMLLKERGVEK